MKMRQIFMTAALGSLIIASAAFGAMTTKDAETIAKKSLESHLAGRLLNPVQYDSILTIPVHSRTINRNDFFLLYFLKDQQFRAEMAVDAKTRTATLLSSEKILPPYFDTQNGKFNFRYFNADSIKEEAVRRFRLTPDSVRMVFFMVTPQLGRRGTIWEIFTSQGIKYIHLGATAIEIAALYKELNQSQKEKGNYAADSLRVREIVDMLKRAEALNPEQIKLFMHTSRSLDSLRAALVMEKTGIYLRFPDMRGRFEPPAPPPDTMQKK